MDWGSILQLHVLTVIFNILPGIDSFYPPK